jgi:hypothetical protein
MYPSFDHNAPVEIHCVNEDTLGVGLLVVALNPGLDFVDFVYLGVGVLVLIMSSD